MEEAIDKKAIVSSRHLDSENGDKCREKGQRSWTHSKLLGAPPTVKDPADRAYGDKNDDRNNDCPACADHLVIIVS